MDDSYFRTIETGDLDLGIGTLQMITVKSPSLKMRSDISLYIPGNTQLPANTPVVILLHGVYGSHWAWFLNARAHVTLHNLIESGRVPPMILVAPSDGLWGDGSGYLKHKSKDFEKWIVDDVPRAVSEVTGNAPDASHYIAGLSMGGFGALRLGAKYCHLFRAFAGLSSITEFSQLTQFIEEPLGDYAQTDNPSVIEEIKQHSKQSLKFQFNCGLGDPLIENNRRLHHQLNELGIEHTYHEYQGSHEWPYWSAHIGETLQFFAEHESVREN